MFSVNKIKKVASLAGVQEVDSFESKLIESLPNEYRQFLEQYNGGKPSKYFHRSGQVIRYFFALTDETIYSLEYHYQIYTLAKRMPENMLPIATDFGGNCFCISVGGPDKGKIYFWDHDGETSGYDNLDLLEESFLKFVEELEDEPDYI